VLAKFDELLSVFGSDETDSAPLELPYKLVEDPSRTDSPHRPQPSALLDRTLCELTTESHYPDKRSVERTE